MVTVLEEDHIVLWALSHPLTPHVAVRMIFHQLLSCSCWNCTRLGYNHILLVPKTLNLFFILGDMSEFWRFPSGENIELFNTLRAGAELLLFQVMQNRDSTNSEVVRWGYDWQATVMTSCSSIKRRPCSQWKNRRWSHHFWLCLGTEVVRLYSGIFNILNTIGNETDSSDAKEEI